MITLDSEFKDKAITNLLSQSISEDMIAYKLQNKLTARNLLHFVIAYSYIFPKSGKIIPLIPLGELFFSQSSVIEPRNIVCQYVLMFESENDKTAFFNWTSRLGKRNRLLPGPEINTEMLPVYPISYELKTKPDHLSGETYNVLTEENLQDISWLEQRCSGRWYFHNNMLFFLDREPIMEWKLRKRDE
jgi:hypothetical protein